jgi:hypothetical protein
MKLRKKHWAFMLGFVLVYGLAKAYVTYTPDPSDDEYPDKIKDAVMLMVYDPEAPEVEPDTSCVSEEDCAKIPVSQDDEPTVRYT